MLKYIFIPSLIKCNVIFLTYKHLAYQSISNQKKVESRDRRSYRDKITKSLKFKSHRDSSVRFFSEKLYFAQPKHINNVNKRKFLILRMAEEYERFEITDYDLDNEFNPNRNRRRPTKKQQIYGKCFYFFRF